jgi:hypothetical protein
MAEDEASWGGDPESSIGRQVNSHIAQFAGDCHLEFGLHSTLGMMLHVLHVAPTKNPTT